MQVFISVTSEMLCYLRAKRWLHPTCNSRPTSPARHRNSAHFIAVCPRSIEPRSTWFSAFNGHIDLTWRANEPLLTDRPFEPGADLFGLESRALVPIAPLQVCRPTASRGRKSRRWMRSRPLEADS